MSQLTNVEIVQRAIDALNQRRRWRQTCRYRLQFHFHVLLFPFLLLELHYATRTDRRPASNSAAGAAFLNRKDVC